MREIKFRGRNIEGEWFYGDLINININNTPTAFIFPPDAPNSYDRYLVNPNTVGQFTGLHDKNGKEIYEGDIILSKLKRARKYDERLVICFDDFEWQCKNANGATTSLSLLVEYHTIEVIGNIHDNPELLKR